MKKGKFKTLFVIEPFLISSSPVTDDDSENLKDIDASFEDGGFYNNWGLGKNFSFIQNKYNLTV